MCLSSPSGVIDFQAFAGTVGPDFPSTFPRRLFLQARLPLPSGLCSWVLRAYPLFESLMHLVGFDALFRRQQLIKLRRGFGANCNEFSQEATLFNGEFLDIAL